MNRFDEMMLEIYAAAKAAAYDDAEKILLQEKDFRSLGKLSELRKNDNLALDTNSPIPST